jgi:hypothetical protein
MAVHYLTGIILTQAYLPAPGRSEADMYPSWGLGVFALRSADASRLLRIMLLATPRSEPPSACGPEWYPGA